MKSIEHGIFQGPLNIVGGLLLLTASFHRSLVLRADQNPFQALNKRLNILFDRAQLCRQILFMKPIQHGFEEFIQFVHLFFYLHLLHDLVAFRCSYDHRWVAAANFIASPIINIS